MSSSMCQRPPLHKVAFFLLESVAHLMPRMLSVPQTATHPRALAVLPKECYMAAWYEALAWATSHQQPCSIPPCHRQAASLPSAAIHPSSRVGLHIADADAPVHEIDINVETKAVTIM